MSEKLARGDTSLLAEMHATTSGLKVFVTTATVRDVETARRSMGGHGFSIFSGLSRVYGQYLPSATLVFLSLPQTQPHTTGRFEGDNFVLDHQVVRAALKAHAITVATMTKFTFSPSTSYLRLLNASPVEPTVKTWGDTEELALLLEFRAARVVAAHAQAVSGGEPDAGASNRVSAAVTGAFVARQVAEMASNLASTGLGSKSATVLAKLYLLVRHGFYTYIILYTDSFAPSTYSSKLRQLWLISTRSSSYRLPPLPTRIPRVRCVSQSQTSAASCFLTRLGSPTHSGSPTGSLIGMLSYQFYNGLLILRSALGVQDGRAYEALVERVKTEPMNSMAVTPAYEVRAEWFPALCLKLMRHRNRSARCCSEASVALRRKGRNFDVVCTSISSEEKNAG